MDWLQNILSTASGVYTNYSEAEIARRNAQAAAANNSTWSKIGSTLLSYLPVILLGVAAVLLVAWFFNRKKS